MDQGKTRSLYVSHLPLSYRAGEDDFDLNTVWTRKEMGFAKKFFRDKDVDGSERRLQRSGVSATFV